MLEMTERRSTFYMKTDIQLADARLRNLHSEAASALVARQPVVEQLARQLGLAGVVTPLAAGSYHVVHRLDRDQGPSLVVRSAIDGLFAEDRSLLIERGVAAWLKAEAHLVPQTHAVGFRGQGAPFDYAVLSIASGSCVRDLGDSILDDDPRVLPAIGASLRRVHAVEAAGAGLLDCEELGKRPKGVLARWPDYITLRLDDHIAACLAAGYLDQPLATRIAELFSVMNPMLERRPMRLLHGDPGIHNICIDPESAEITAWLDWEDALAGDPLFDVAMFSTFQPPRRMPAFLSGYGLAEPSATQARLLALYFLRIALSKTVHRLRFGVADRPDRTPGHHRIYRGVDELERLL